MIAENNSTLSVITKTLNALNVSRTELNIIFLTLLHSAHHITHDHRICENNTMPKYLFLSATSLQATGLRSLFIIIVKNKSYLIRLRLLWTTMRRKYNGVKTGVDNLALVILV